MNHIVEYNLQTLLYVSRPAIEGDLSSVSRMGIRYDQAEKIIAMSTQEIQDVAQAVKAHFMRIAFDADALDKAFSISAMRCKERSDIIQLLKSGASCPVLKQLYGLNSSDVSAYRKFLNLPKADGRPPIPDEKQQLAIWENWQKSETADLSPTDQLLMIHRQTGVKINQIWALLQAWLRDPQIESG